MSSEKPLTWREARDLRKGDKVVFTRPYTAHYRELTDLQENPRHTGRNSFLRLNCGGGDESTARERLCSAGARRQESPSRAELRHRRHDFSRHRHKQPSSGGVGYLGPGCAIRPTQFLESAASDRYRPKAARFWRPVRRTNHHYERLGCRRACSPKLSKRAGIVRGPLQRFFQSER
jgi:hypothetical protein